MPAKKKAKGSLFDRIKGVNTIKKMDVIKNSKFFVEEFYDTGIPILNLALSAKLNGGFTYGTTILAGESKTAKSLFMLIMAKQFLEQHEDAFMIFYDCEFGINRNMLESVGIDQTRIIHKPIENIEEFKHDFTVTMKEIDEKDNVFIGVDSFGEMASAKEVEDAEEGNNVVDMTRAKALNSTMRIAKPILNIKKVPMVAIGKTYKTQERFAKDVLGGGQGLTKQSDSILFVSKTKEKDGKTQEGGDANFIGSTFNITVNKGRLVRENAKFRIKITYENGLDVYSDLLNHALVTGHVTKPSNGWFSKGGDEKKFRRADTSTPEFWDSILADESFCEAMNKRYSLGSIRGGSEEITDEIPDIDEEDV